MLARMVLPPNCMPDSDCIFHFLLSPSRSFIPLSSANISSLSISGTSICEQPTPGGTPVRKRGIRNVIAPLREVSWYEEHPLVLSFSSATFRSHLDLALALSLSLLGRTSRRGIGQSVLRARLDVLALCFQAGPA